MNFYDELASVTDEQKRKAFALDYVCRVYGLDARDVRVPEQGEQTYTFIARNKVVRLARSEGMSKIMGHEVEVLNTIEGKTDLLTPRVLDYRPDQNNLVSISRLPGDTLSHNGFAAFGKLGQTGQDDIARKMGKFLGQMHRAFPQSESIDVPWRDEVLHKINAALRQETDPQKRERLQAADRYLQAYGKGDGPYVMLHGDLHPGNIMYDHATGALGVIDFGSAKMGSPHRDFIKVRRSMSDHHYHAVIDGYEKETGWKIDLAKVDIAVDVFDIAVSGKLSQRAVGPTSEDETTAPERSSRHPAAPAQQAVGKPHYLTP